MPQAIEVSNIEACGISLAAIRHLGSNASRLNCWLRSNVIAWPAGHTFIKLHAHAVEES